MSYEVGILGFLIHVKSENENSMTIYELIRFNLFLVSGILYFPVWSYVETMPCGDSHHRFPINTKKKYCKWSSINYSCTAWVQSNLQFLRFFFHFPNVSYLKIINCGGSHLEFPIDTNTHICKRLSKAYSSNVCSLMA